MTKKIGSVPVIFILLTLLLTGCAGDVGGDFPTETETTTEYLTETEDTTAVIETETDTERITETETETETGEVTSAPEETTLADPKTCVHEYDEGYVTEPTCTEKGYLVRTCRLCGSVKKTKNAAKLGHKYEKQTVKEPTCTKKGVYQYVCIRCGKTGTGTYGISALGHDYGDWITDKEPTCRETGSHFRQCSRCEKRITEELPVIDHIYTEEATCDKPRLCVMCGDVLTGSFPLGHRYDMAETKIVSYSPDGPIIWEHVCGVCGKTEQVISQAEVPEELVNTSVMRAMSYLGHDIEGQVSAGNLFTVYGRSFLAEKYRAGIKYDLKGVNGVEGINTVQKKVGKKTVTVPDVERFRKRGLICASFTGYYLLNYLPNVEGMDISGIRTGFDYYMNKKCHLRSAYTWHLALEYDAKKGYAELIGTSAEDVDREKLSPGDVIVFGHEDYAWSHVAIYAGTVDGEDFVFHCAYLRGVELTTLSQIADPYGDGSVRGSVPKEIYHLEAVKKHDGQYTEGEVK